MQADHDARDEADRDKLNHGCDPGHKPGAATQGGELRSELPRISQRVDQLDRAMTSLPHVDENGSSECPRAEDSYAKKEQLEAQVSSDIGTLNGYMTALDEEVQRCTDNLQRIGAGHGKLNLQETSVCFSEATEAQERQLRSAVQDRDAVYVVLARAEAVLKVSRTRKFPGREPQEQPSLPGALSGTSQLPGPQPSGGGLGNELNGLLSLGPLEPDRGK